MADKGIRMHYRSASILLSASLTRSAFCGRTRRVISWPSRKKISVGHSFTLKLRPSGRPLPSSILRCLMEGWPANAVVTKGCAARQWPHQSVPNSMTREPFDASMSARFGSEVEYAASIPMSHQQSCQVRRRITGKCVEDSFSQIGMFKRAGTIVDFARLDVTRKINNDEPRQQQCNDNEQRLVFHEMYHG